MSYQHLEILVLIPSPPNDEALAGTEVVGDVTNSPSFEDKAVVEFFEKSGHNIIAAEVKAGVEHHVALSAVSTEHVQASGFFRAKMAQKN